MTLQLGAYVQSHFDELADNYIKTRIRMPVLQDSQLSDIVLEQWGSSLSGLTKFHKFKELGNVMYGDPAQGPNIVERIDFDKNQDFLQ